jgi:hypothetical protein
VLGHGYVTTNYIPAPKKNPRKVHSGDGGLRRQVVICGHA